EEPRAEAVLSVVLMKPRESAEERLLRRVAGRFRVPQEARGERVNGGVEPEDERRLGVTFTPAGTLGPSLGRLPRPEIPLRHHFLLRRAPPSVSCYSRPCRRLLVECRKPGPKDVRPAGAGRGPHQNGGHLIPAWERERNSGGNRLDAPGVSEACTFRN